MMYVTTFNICVKLLSCQDYQNIAHNDRFLNYAQLTLIRLMTYVYVII